MRVIGSKGTDGTGNTFANVSNGAPRGSQGDSLGYDSSARSNIGRRLHLVAKNKRGLENGKALSELSAKALLTNGYRLASWGQESKKGGTAFAFPQKYEKEYVLEGVPFHSYIELATPQTDSARIDVSIYSGIVCVYRGHKNGGPLPKLNELDIQTLEIRAWQNFKTNAKQ